MFSSEKEKPVTKMGKASIFEGFLVHFSFLKNKASELNFLIPDLPFEYLKYYRACCMHLNPISHGRKIDEDGRRGKILPTHCNF